MTDSGHERQKLVRFGVNCIIVTLTGFCIVILWHCNLCRIWSRKGRNTSQICGSVVDVDFLRVVSKFSRRRCLVQILADTTAPQNTQTYFYFQISTNAPFLAAVRNCVSTKKVPTNVFASRAICAIQMTTPDVRRRRGTPPYCSPGSTISAKFLWIIMKCRWSSIIPNPRPPWTSFFVLVWSFGATLPNRKYTSKSPCKALILI